MTETKQWYALYTRVRWEKKVADLLQRKNIEHYCPLNKVQKQWADRKKIVYEPLFSAYVFVHISKAEYITTLQTDGVLHFVQYLNKPAVIRDEEIDVIRRFLSECQDVRVERYEVSIHDKVRITDGAFSSLEGEVIEVRNRTVRVLLPSLGYALVAEIEKNHLEKLMVNASV